MSNPRSNTHVHAPRTIEPRKVRVFMDKVVVPH